MDILVAQDHHVEQIWPHIKNWLVHSRFGRPRKYSAKSILAGIFYISKTGCQWSALPKEFPPWKSVYYHFRKWTNSGIWFLLNKKLREIIRLKRSRSRYSKAVCIDSQSVKTLFGVGAVGFDGNKKVKGRKRHFLVDSIGLLIAVCCTKANLHDSGPCKMLIKRIHKYAHLSNVKYIHADKAYRSVKTLSPKIKMNISGSIKSSGFQPIPLRWKVERSIAWLRGYRRTLCDMEKKVRYSEAWVYIAFIQLCSKRVDITGGLFR